MKIIDAIYLLVISIGIKFIVTVKKLPSNDIDTYIRIASLRSVPKLGPTRFFQLLINPISSIRYLEFDIIRRAVTFADKHVVLDVSSPRAFGLFIAHSYPKLKYQMINPDPNDIDETEIIKNAFHLNNFYLKKANALNLPYPDKYFDTVISISVIEHISSPDDKKVLRQMWRVLKPGGQLILTTHVMKKERIEYRDNDQYGVGSKKKKGRYFFQRIYDQQSLKKRIIDTLGEPPLKTEIFGENQTGWFDKYINRWAKYGLKETVFDPWYIVNNFQYYQTIRQLPGIGVIGMVFSKPNANLN